MPVPEGIVVAVQDIADIPAGWTRVAELNGKFPKISMMDRDFEGTQNIINSQPTAATGIGTWLNSGTNTIEAISLPTEGIPSLRLPTGQFITTAFKCTYQDSLTMLQSAAITILDQLHTISCYVYVDSGWGGSQDLKVRAAAAFGSHTEVEAVTHDPVESGVWRPVKQTFDPDAGDLLGSVQFSVLGGGVAPNAGDVLYITAIQLEAKDHRTSFCDGNQPGCVWDGAAHASTSTRASTEASRSGGAASHTHTSLAHTHSVNSHSHISNPNLIPDPGQHPGAGADHGYNDLAAATGHSHIVGPTTVDGSGTTGSTVAGWTTQSNEPEHVTIIFIRSDGTPLGMPPNAISWWQLHELPVDYESVFLNKYFKGAAIGLGGGTTGGFSSHSHAGLSHVHSVGVHTHQFASASEGGLGNQSGPATISSGGSVPNTTNTANRSHRHVLTVLSSPSVLAAALSLANGLVLNDPSHVSLWAMKNMGIEDDILDQTIVLWDASLSDIPIGYVPCNGAFFTPDLRNKFIKNSDVEGSVGAVGGAHTHLHPDPSAHTHSAAHVHPIDSAGPTNSTQDAGPYSNPTSRDDHVHADTNSASGGGTTTGAVQKNSSSNNEPPYYQMHAIRLGVGTPGLSDPYSRVSGIIT